jgi:hypothetical protein
MKLRILHAASVLPLFLVVAAYAEDKLSPESQQTPQATQAAQKAKQANEAELKEHGHYVNKDGNVIHSPAHSATGQVPSGATAKCADGTYSFSQNHRGTCSHHGGVASWIGD